MIRQVPSHGGENRAKIRKPPVTDLESGQSEPVVAASDDAWTPMPPRKMPMRPRMPPPKRGRRRPGQIARRRSG